MKSSKLFLVGLLLISVLNADELKVGTSTSSSNGKTNNVYSFGAKLHYDFNEKISDELSGTKFYSTSNGDKNTDLTSAKNLVFYKLSDSDKMYFKYKFTKDGIGDIKDQSMEMLGYSRIVKTSTGDYGVKVGLGKLQQLGFDRDATDFGFMYTKQIDTYLTFNFNNDYVGFSGGNANDLKTSLEYSLNKSFILAVNYYNLHNKMDALKSNFNKTEVSLSYKF